MTSIRVLQFARKIGVPHQELLHRIKKDAPKVPVDSVMSYLTEEDILLVVKALAIHPPRHDFEGTPYREYAMWCVDDYETQERKKAYMEAIHSTATTTTPAPSSPRFGDRSLPEDTQWSLFSATINRIRQAEHQAKPQPGRELIKLDDVTLHEVATHERWGGVMARRRAAMTTLGQQYRRFSYGLIEDIKLIEADHAFHEALQEARPQALKRAQDLVGLFFERMEIDWTYATRYILDYIKEDEPQVSTITEQTLREQLACDDELPGELQTALGYEELTEEQITRIRPWLEGQGEVDYTWLREVMDDDNVVFHSALSFEDRRAEHVMITTCLEHVMGHGEALTYITLNEETENTRYRFDLYVGEGGIASVLVSFDL